MEFRDWKMGVAVPAVLVGGCVDAKTFSPEEAAKWEVKPAPKPAPKAEPTPESLARDYENARRQADLWQDRWKTADALKGAIERGRPAEEIARRRAEFDAAWK